MGNIFIPDVAAVAAYYSCLLYIHLSQGIQVSIKLPSGLIATLLTVSNYRTFPVTPPNARSGANADDEKKETKRTYPEL